MSVKKLKFTVVLSLLLLAVILFASIPLSQNSVLSSAQSDEHFTVEIYGRDGSRMLEGSSVPYNNGAGYVFKWQDANKFTFNINPEGLNVKPKHDANNTPFYNVSININYLRNYRENQNLWNSPSRYTFENLAQYSIVKRGENSLNELVNYKPEFLIDEGITGTTTTGINAAAKEWGVYQFTLSIDGANKLTIDSDYIIIEPTRDIFEAPKAKMTITSSETSLRDAYLFTLENEEAYRYIDSTKLTWYAKGTATDGTKYALVQMDVGVGECNDCTAALYDNEKLRTGLNFIFEDQGKYGQWEIWCIYKPEGASAEQMSNRIEIETKKQVSYDYLYWLIAAAAIVAIGVTLGISLYKNKREKVY